MAKKPWKVWTVRGAWLVGALGITAFVLVNADYWIAASELPAAMAEAKKVGVPLTAQELSGSDHYLAIADGRLAGIDLGQLDVLYVHLERPDQEWGASAEVVASYERSVRDAQTKLDAGVLGPPADWDTFPVEDHFDDVTMLGDLTTGLCSVAIVKAHNGEFREACRLLASCRNLAKACGTLPTYWYPIGVNRVINRTVELCLPDMARSPEALQLLQETVMDQEPVSDFTKELKWDAFMSVAIARNFNEFGGEAVWNQVGSIGGTSRPAPPHVVRSGEPRALIGRAYLARSLQYWNQLFGHLKAHPNDWDGLVKIDDRFQRPWEHGPQRDSWLLAQATSPLFIFMTSYRDNFVADYRCKSALVTVLAYRARKGRLPASLHEAGCDLIDPFDKKPLRYRVTRDSAQVWSIGRDGVDNEGTALEGRTTGSDVIASFPPIPKKKLGSANQGDVIRSLKAKS